MDCVVVTPNSALSWVGAADMMEVPMELCDGSLGLISVFFVLGQVLKPTYASRAIEAVMAICMAFFPEGQLYGFAGSLLQSQVLASSSLDASSESVPLPPGPIREFRELSSAFSARSCDFPPLSGIIDVMLSTTLGSSLIDSGSCLLARSRVWGWVVDNPNLYPKLRSTKSYTPP